MEHYEYMRLAISLAKATIGQTSPNPSVAAVLVKDGQLISTGIHRKAGEPHAEVIAIQSAGEHAKGATLYVTLEPCCHFGKTPPCADLIINSGIKKVVVSCLDPNPLVAGKGIEKLRDAGIEVEVGVLEEEGRQINEMFFHWIQTKTPYVTLKAAVTFDGKIATKTGDSKWITSPEARRDVHNVRHEHDAILVGIGTVLKDNPLLTTRRPQGGKNPVRIILDTHLKMPLSANVVQDRSAKTYIFTGNQIDETKKSELEEYGVGIITLPSSNIAIQDVLKVLGDMKIMSVLVEGGSEIHASFIKVQAFQKMIVYIAPKIIGGQNAYHFVGGEGTEKMVDATKLEFLNVEKIGPDLKITAKPIKNK